MAHFSHDIMQRLQQEILPLQGYSASGSGKTDVGLGVIQDAFPQRRFPTGAIHEFIAGNRESLAATSGFLAGILSALMKKNAAAIWIGTSTRIYPPALLAYNIHPEHIIFLDLKKSTDKLWAAEESLKCEGLAAVICETADLDFTASRRLQLAVEQSKVTGFILRNDLRRINTTACLTRWEIKPLPSHTIGDLPGPGYPRWKVDLLKARNGKPGSWELEWVAGKFQLLPAISPQQEYLIKTA